MSDRVACRPSVAFCERVEPRTLLAAVTVQGTSAADEIRVSMSENGSTIFVDVNGFISGYPDVVFDGVSIEGGNGRDMIYVDSNGENRVTVNGGGGDDTVSLGELAHDLDPITEPVVIASSGGADQLWLFDEESAFSSNYTFTAGAVSRDFFAGVTFPTQSIVRLYATAFNDTITVNGTAGSGRLELFGARGDDLFRINDTNGATVVVDGNSFNYGGSDRLEVNELGAAPATVTFEGTQIFSTVDAFPGSQIVADRNVGIVLTTNLSNFDGTVTLADGFILETNSRVAGGLGYWRGRIANGVAGTGAQLKSSDVGGTSPLGIGYAYGNSLGFNTIMEQPIGADDLLVRVTLKGDANLDRAVTFDDLLSLAQNYGTASAVDWAQGDFNLSRSVTFDDLLALAQNYGATAAMKLATPPAATPAARRRPALALV